MSVKIDLKDKKLLYHLSQSARTPHTQLAKKIGLSKNAVTYRIERLKKEGVIQYFTTALHLGNLGLDTFTLLLRFNTPLDDSILNFFKNHPYANWVVTLSGNWDVFAEFVYTGIMDHHRITNEIIKTFSEKLNTYTTFFSFDCIKVEHFPGDFYQDPEPKPPLIRQKPHHQFKADEIDKKILYILSQDASLTYPALAQQVGVGINVIRYRLKQLEKNGVLLKTFAEVNRQQLGYTDYLYVLHLKNLSESSMQKIRKAIQSNLNVNYAFFDTCSYNLIFTCSFKDSHGVDQLTHTLRQDYRNIIDRQEYMILCDQLVFNLFPKGLLG